MINENLENEKEKRRVRTLSENLELLLNNQISHEMYNHNLYKSFGNYFKVNGLSKLEEYFNDRAKEELVHHGWIIDYLNECDVPTLYPEIKEVDVEITNYIDPFGLTIDAEIETTVLINNIVDVAMEEKDWQTFQWLMEKLVPEQHEEEEISREIFRLATVDTDWLTIQDFILERYKK